MTIFSKYFTKIFVFLKFLHFQQRNTFTLVKNKQFYTHNDNNSIYETKLNVFVGCISVKFYISRY